MTPARPPRPGLRALAVAMGALTVAAALALVVVALADPSAAGPASSGPSGPRPGDRAADDGDFLALMALAAIVFAAFGLVGAVVAARRPRNAVGWLCGAAALGWALGVLANDLYWHLAFGRRDPPPAADLVAWFGNWNTIPPIVILFCLLPLLFPTGAPPGPRWRAVGWGAIAIGGTCVLSTALAPGPLDRSDSAWIDNPLPVGGLGLATVSDVSFALLPVLALAAIASLVVRFRRSRGIERLQLQWVAAAGCLLPVLALGGNLLSGVLGTGAGWIGTLLGLLGIVGAVGVALLRHRLYDLDVVLNRALVYSALTATLAAAYLGTVLLLQLVLSPSSDLAVAASTLAVAALVRPARSRIQRLVDRRFFRRRYDAAVTLARFSVHVRDEVALDAVAGELRRVVDETLQPAHVSLWLRAPAPAPPDRR